MWFNERRIKLVNYINENGSVSTKELSSVFKISEQTIRKDLQLLDDFGKIQKIHGGGKKIGGFYERLDKNIDFIPPLCKIASTFIEENDVVFIDGGSTYYHLMDYIDIGLSFSIITASVPIALRFKQKLPKVQVLLLGGFMDSVTFETDCKNYLSEIKDIIVTKSFIGVSGFSKEFHFTEDNINIMNLKKHIVNQSSKNIIIADKSKEEYIGFQRAFLFSEIDVFITNKGINQSLVQVLEKSLELVLI